MIDLCDLAEGSWVTIDTAPLIYLLEDNTAFLEAYLPLFEEIEAGRLRGLSRW